MLLCLLLLFPLPGCLLTFSPGQFSLISQDSFLSHPLPRHQEDLRALIPCSYFDHLVTASSQHDLSKIEATSSYSPATFQGPESRPYTTLSLGLFQPCFLPSPLYLLSRSLLLLFWKCQISSHPGAFVLAAPLSHLGVCSSQKSFSWISTPQFHVSLQHLALSTIMLLCMLIVSLSLEDARSIEPETISEGTFLISLLSHITVIQWTLVIFVATHHLLNSLPSFRCQIPSLLCSWAQECDLGPASLACPWETDMQVGAARGHRPRQELPALPMWIAAEGPGFAGGAHGNSSFSVEVRLGF